MRDVIKDIRGRNPEIQKRTLAWNALVNNYEGHVRIKVNPRCKWLIYNCENLKYITGTSIIWEPTIKDIERDKNLKFTKHIWDAASYLIERYDPIKPVQDARTQARSKVITVPFRV
jgi:hypothetical protein